MHVTFHGEGIQKGSTYRKTCSVLLAIRELELQLAWGTAVYSPEGLKWDPWATPSVRTFTADVDWHS